MQKREAEASGRSTHVVRAHYPNIQNVRLSISESSNDLTCSHTDYLPHRPRSYRRPLLCQQRVRSPGHHGVATVSTPLITYERPALLITAILIGE